MTGEELFAVAALAFARSARGTQLDEAYAAQERKWGAYHRHACTTMAVVPYVLASWKPEDIRIHEALRKRAGSAAEQQEICNGFLSGVPLQTLVFVNFSHGDTAHTLLHGYEAFVALGFDRSPDALCRAYITRDMEWVESAENGARAIADILRTANDDSKEDAAWSMLRKRINAFDIPCVFIRDPDEAYLQTLTTAYR